MLRDILVVVWRNWRAFRRDMLSQISILFILVLIAGVLCPWLLIQGELTEVDNWDYWVDFEVFFVCYIFSTAISGSSFHLERRSETLHVLLSSPIRPQCIFIGKWAWMMAVVITASILSCLLARTTIFLFTRMTWSNWDAMLFSVGSQIVTAGICSWVIAANSMVSLLFRDTKISQLLGSFLGYLPFLLALISTNTIEIRPNLNGMLITSIVSLVLASLSFYFSILVFRSESVRF